MTIDQKIRVLKLGARVFKSIKATHMPTSSNSFSITLAAFLTQISNSFLILLADIPHLSMTLAPPNLLSS
jgi:hypothetical protein